MNNDRRAFLQLSLAAGALAATHGLAGAQQQAAKAPAQRAGSPKKILILGGTGFLGPAIVAAARERGHTLTLFNRGKTRPGLFTDIEQLHGDRDPLKGEGIKPLEGHKWDAVIDDCGYYPRMVSASAELLAPNVGQYIYISSISCYAKNDVLGADETTELATLADPKVETMGANYENYGGLKVLCEQAAEKATPGRATIVRPGYIVGPEDPTDRFTYWPVRVARGGEVLAPGTPLDPIQIIDVRDLGMWLVKLVEDKTIGTFNACGPATKLTMGDVMNGCKAASTNDAKFTWVPASFLGEQQGVELPIWAPAEGESKGFHTWSNARAVKAGLTFRPASETSKDTLAWFRAQPEERQKLRAGVTPEREAEVLKAWHEREG